MSTKQVALGFVAAAVVGGGAGASLSVGAAGLVHRGTEPPAAPNSLEPPLTVTRVVGAGEALTREGTWRVLRPGERLSRPVALRTRGFGSEVQLSFRGTEVVAGHDADLVIGAPGMEGWLQLDAGRALVVRKARPLTTAVPSRALEISGTSYAVRVVGSRVTLAVLEGEAAVKRGDDAPVTFGRAREVLINDKQMTPLVIEPKLELTVTGVTKIGKKATIAGKTSALAEVFLDRGGGLEGIPLSPAGGFTFELEGGELPSGALVAVDALGRRAEPNRPSIGLEELLANLGGASGSAPAAAAPTSPSAAAPAPAPAEPPPAPPPAAAAPAPAEQAAPAEKAEPTKVSAPKPATIEPPAPVEKAKKAAPDRPSSGQSPPPADAKPPPAKAPKTVAPQAPSLPAEPPAAKVPSAKKPAPEETTEEADDEPPPRPSDPPPPPKPAPKEAEEEGSIDEDQL